MKNRDAFDSIWKEKSTNPHNPKYDCLSFVVGWEACEEFTHTRSCKDCVQLQTKGDSKWCTHTIYKNDSLDGFHCCLWESNYIKKLSKEVTSFDIPCGEVYVDIKAGRIEVSQLTEKQFVEAFGCSRKEFKMSDELHLLLIARLNVIEGILVNKLGIDSKELETLYLKEVKELQNRILKVTNKESK